MSIFAQTYETAPFNGGTLIGSNTKSTTSFWTIQFQQSISNNPWGPGTYGIETDGTYLFISKWASNKFYKLTTAGVVVDSFSVTGTINGGIRDLAFDGTYFYGSNNSNIIYKMDFVAKTIVSTIVLPIDFYVRHIAYDPTANNGNGGLWVGPWSVMGPRLYSMTGNYLDSIPAANLGTYSASGSAFDNVSAGGPYLWLSSYSTGVAANNLIKIHIPTKQISLIHDISMEIPAIANTTPGGLFQKTNLISGTTTLGGLTQGTHIWGFNLATTIPPANGMQINTLDLLNNVPINSPQIVSGQLVNIGTNTITSFKLNYSVNGGSNLIQNVTSVNIAGSSNYNYSHSIPWTPSIAGTYTIRLWASEINGNTSLSSDTITKIVNVMANIVYKKVVLEQFTGIKLPYCDGNKIARDYKALHPNDVFIINIHQGSYSSPDIGQPDYRTIFGDALANQTGLTGYPTGTINRHVFPPSTTTILNRNQWESKGNELLATLTYATMDIISANVDVLSRLLTVTANVNYINNGPPLNLLNIALIQNNIAGYQSGGLTYDPTMVMPNGDYNHQNMLRHLLTGQWGDTILNTTSGTSIQRTYTYTIPNDINAINLDLVNLKIIGFLAEGKQEIVTGTEKNITLINNQSLLLNEHFDYPTGDSISGHGWAGHSGLGTNTILASPGSLTYSGYPTSVGNKVTLNISGQDINKGFATQNVGYSIYTAALVNVTAATATGDYFLHLMKPGSTSPLVARVYVKKDTTVTPNKIKFGFMKGSTASNIIYTTASYEMNTTHLIVTKYTINQGLANDIAFLFVNPPINSEGIPTIIASDISQPDLDTISQGIALRQGSSTNAPNLSIDEIRVANNWNAAIGFSNTNITPIVTSDSVKSITLNSAICYGNITSYGSSLITERGICFGSSFNPDISGNKVIVSGTAIGNFNGNINGLTSNTLYHFRTFATNGVGTSYGNDMTFTTASTPVAPIITTGTTTSITTNTATISSEVINDGGATITERGICWSISLNPTISNSKVIVAGTTGLYSGNLSGLTSGTLYHYRAYAINNIGITYGADLTFTTLQPIVTILNEGFEGATFPPTGWTKQNYTTNQSYQWKEGTTSHTGLKGAMIDWDPSLSPQNEWLISPSVNLTSLTYPALEFWWSMSYYWGVSPNNNYDFRVKISTNGGTTWTTIWTEDSVSLFGQFIYKKTVINLSNFATTTNFKVAFQYQGTDGANLYLDDISIKDLEKHKLEFQEVWNGFVNFNAPFVWSGYTQIPFGQSFPVSFSADIKNAGSQIQNNVKIKVKELTTGISTVSTNIPPISLSFQQHDTLDIVNALTIAAQGTYNFVMSASSDSVAESFYNDTAKVTVNSDVNGIFSRDNNNYDGSKAWNGVTAGNVEPYQLANLYEITQNTNATSISFVIGSGTTIGAATRVLLYEGWSRNLIAQSDYHLINANEINNSSSTNPIEVNLGFANGSLQQLKKDSVYFVAVQAFGGTDSLWIATSSNNQQPNFSLYIFDTDNKWYYYPKGTRPFMIRLHTAISNLAGTGTISGLTTVCQGQNNVNYTVTPIQNATSYIWTLPNGAIGISTTNTISVNFGTNAISGNISVKGHNAFGDGPVNTFPIIVNPLPTLINNYQTLLYENFQSGIIPSNFIIYNDTNTVHSNIVNLFPNGWNVLKEPADTSNKVAGSPSWFNSIVQADRWMITPSLSIPANYQLTWRAKAQDSLWPDGYSVKLSTTGANKTDFTATLFSVSAENPSWTNHNVSLAAYAGQNVRIAFVQNSTDKFYILVDDIKISSPNSGITPIINGLTNICNGQNNVLYSVTPIQYAANYIWTMPNGITGTSLTDSIYLNFNQNAQSGNIIVRGQNACGLSDSVSLFVNASQGIPDTALYIIGQFTVCPGQSYVNFSIPAINNVSSYLWTLPVGASGTSTTNSIWVDFGTNAVSGNITVKGFNACGYGSTKSAYITVSQLPSTATTITGNTSVCQGQNNVTYTVPVISNATSYIWTLPYGVSGSSNTNSITVSFGTNAFSGNIGVQGSNVCGIGNSSSIPITVNPLPGFAGTISGSTNLCQGQSNVTYSCPSIQYATSYIWTLPGGFTGTSSTNSITAAISANAISGLVKVKVNNSCGEGSESQLFVTVNPLPTSGIIGQVNTQPYQTETYSVSSQSNCTYNWTVNNGNILSGQGTNVITIQWGNYGTGQVNVTVANTSSSCSSSSQVSVNIGGNLPNAAGAITGSVQVCQGQNNVVYSVPVIQNATSYIWQKPDGMFDTTAINSISINFALNAQSGILTVRGHNALGDGISSSFTITVNPIPATPVINQNGDSLISSSLSGNQWYNLATGIINNAASQIYMPQQIGNYFVIVSLNGCSSDSSNIIYFDNTGITDNQNKSMDIKVMPNPFTDKTSIVYTIKESKHIIIVISDITGREIRVLCDEKQQKGEHNLIFDAENLANGIYFYRLNADKEVFTGKIILNN